MFKNFLTYEWAIRFQSQIQAQSNLSPKRKDRALKSSTLLVHHLSRALGAAQAKEAARHYCVSVMCLRDAWEEIAAEKTELCQHSSTPPSWMSALEGVFRTLEHRLVQLTEDASTVENGQFRMLG